MTVETLSGIGLDDVGTGEPALLGMPGWCGERTAFDPLLPRFAAHRRALAMDLPDQGGSTWDVEAHPGRDVDTGAIVELALTALEESGVEQVVPVAMAHAGWAAIELRRRLGAERVPGIVLLDWMVLGTPPGFMDALAGLQHEDSWEQVRAALFGMWTTGVEVPAVHEFVDRMGTYGFRHWSRAGREIGAAFREHTSPVAALSSLAPACPTLHVYAQPGDDAVLAAQQAYATDNPWFHVHRLAAHSHFPMFEVPDEIATVVESFVRSLG